MTVEVCRKQRAEGLAYLYSTGCLRSFDFTHSVAGPIRARCAKTCSRSNAFGRGLLVWKLTIIVAGVMWCRQSKFRKGLNRRKTQHAGLTQILVQRHCTVCRPPRLIARSCLLGFLSARFLFGCTCVLYCLGLRFCRSWRSQHSSTASTGNAEVYIS